MSAIPGDEDDDGYCDYCADHVPAKGAWVCPVCDAEWPDEEETTPPNPVSENAE